MAAWMEAEEFLIVLGTRVAKKSANDVYTIVRRAAPELLGFTPRIFMHEVRDKRPYDAIVIELDGEEGGLAIHYRGQSVEFR